MKCPSDQELEQFAIGAASDAAGDAIAGHLSGCARCEQTVSHLERGGDTVLVGLRSAVAIQYSQEPDCLQTVALLKQAIVSSCEASTASLGDVGGPTFATDFKPGTLFGPYRIEGKLGQGGMGTVYQAIHRRLNRVVAIKFIAPHSRDPLMTARFNREMQAVAALDHPAIVRAYDGGEHGGLDYLAMEYVAGLDLARLARLERLSIADACELVRQAALGLAHLHQRGLVHRDVKPSNLILCASGQVKILDLGLARLIEPATRNPLLTEADRPLGTSDYLAPEQAVGSQGIDARADLYSLGATLFRLLAGYAPFDDERHTSALSKLIAHVHEERPKLIAARPETPRMLSDLIEKLMARAPADRPQTAAETAALLAPFAAGANLVALLSQAQRALSVDRSAGRDEAGSNETPPGPGFGDAGTSPDAEPAQALPGGAGPPRLRWSLPVWLLAAAAVGLSILLTVILLKRPDETTARIGVAAGAPVEPLDGTPGDSPVAQSHEPPAAPARGEMRSGADDPEPAASVAAASTLFAGPNARDPALERWLNDVAALSADKLVAAVDRKLQDLNPLFDGKEAHEIDDGVVTELRFFTDNVSDISPLRALTALKVLKCSGSSLRKGRLLDLRALEGMRLTSLTCSHGQISDLSPLRGMPLTELCCEETAVSDLSPLEGMPLTTICLTPKYIRTGLDVIRRMKSLTTIGLDWDRGRFSSDEFWQKYDAEEFGKAITTFDDPAFKQWMKDVAILPAEQQVTAVVRKLQELNPGFDGKEKHKIEFGMVTELEFHSDSVTDISPVRALPRLKSLNCRPYVNGAGASKFWDLSSLAGMRLTHLDCGSTCVSDLSPLKGMPLTYLYLRETLVSDLSPLQGMPLTYLNFHYTQQVTDLSPLQGMPLTFLACGGTQVSDLSPLKGMALTHLSFHGTPVTDLSPLEGMPLTILDCGGRRFSDLSVFRGMPLKELTCSQTQVSDLSPLKGMSLTTLICYETGVSDLSPLTGMPLTLLSCSSTQVADLSPLAGMPLTSLDCEGTGVSDLSPLRGMDLSLFTFTPKNITQGVEVIRQMKSIRSIGLDSYKRSSPDEFWRKYDAGEFGK